jgi:nitroimidazol reductase NimA-like FMN-containing flavoprotein (pyridoxamine 5'-phosphate oxidase superfamily)
VLLFLSWSRESFVHALLHVLVIATCTIGEPIAIPFSYVFANQPHENDWGWRPYLRYEGEENSQ